MSRYRSQGIIVALLLGTLALILYGSLYPFELLPRVHTLTLRETLLEMSWSRSGRGDRIANILLYVPLGFCLFLLLDARIRRRSAVLWSTVCGLLLSYAIELTQVFIVDRVSSYWDVVFNVIGSFVGAAGGIAWYELTARLNSQAGARSRSRKSAMLVVLLWLIWRLWPFVPHFSLGKLKAAFQPLADPNFSGVATLHYLIWWALLAHILFSLVSGQRAIEALLALIAVVLAASLGITVQGFVPSELLALVLLLPTLLVLNRLTPTPRHLLLAAGFVGLLLYESFTPFQLSNTASHFELWPFKSWIDARFPFDIEWLARRACYFAALVWILKESGMPSRTTVILVPLAALGIEIAQLWIPGQQGSITEPVIAFAIAWLIRVLDSPRSATLRRARTL